VQLRALRLSYNLCDRSLFEIDAHFSAWGDGARQEVGLAGVVPHDHDCFVVAVLLDHLDELGEGALRAKRIFFMQLSFEPDLIANE